MARPKRSRRSENSDLITIFAVALFITVAWFAEQPVALQTLTTVSAIAVVLGWWYLFRRPTTTAPWQRRSWFRQTDVAATASTTT